MGSSEDGKVGMAKWKKVLLGCFAGLMGIGVVGAALEGPEPVVAPAQAAAVPQGDASTSAGEADVPSEAVAFAEETTTTAAPATTEAPTTTLALSPLEAFDVALAEESDVIETFYNDEINFLRVEVEKGLVGFWVETELQLEVREILELVAESDLEVENLDVAIHAEFIDQLGNSELDAAIRGSWTGETIEAINFDNFLTDNTFAIGELVYVHPAIQTELS